MSKYNNFYNSLVGVVGNLNTNSVKERLGDSTHNHRTLTVNQVVRFLNTKRTKGLKNLGNSLQNVYEILKEDIIANRLSRRTDAIDINEFISFYESEVICLGNHRGTIGRNVI